MLLKEFTTGSSSFGIRPGKNLLNFIFSLFFFRQGPNLLFGSGEERRKKKSSESISELSLLRRWWGRRQFFVSLWFLFDKSSNNFSTCSTFIFRPLNLGKPPPPSFLISCHFIVELSSSGNRPWEKVRSPSHRTETFTQKKSFTMIPLFPLNTIQILDQD